MPWHPSLNPLRDVLADLYPDVADERRVAASASLPLTRVTLRGKPVNDWQAILEEAAKQACVEDLIAVAVSEYGRNPALLAAVAAYREGTARAASAVRAPPSGQAADSLVLDLDYGVSLALVWVPAGEFLMGSESADHSALDWEMPQHRVWLPEYLIGKYPVTVAQYRAFVQATGYRIGYPDAIRWPDDHPVADVSWSEALAFCDWASTESRRQVRLPSEAEWEKAARWDEAAQQARKYPWGDFWDSHRCNSREHGPGHTTPVQQHSPRGDSPYGCTDMAGNVWEWTRSLWGISAARPDFTYPYDPGRGREDLSAGDEMLRVLRGGSFRLPKEGVRCAMRYRNNPPQHENSFGFRVEVVPLGS